MYSALYSVPSLIHHMIIPSKEAVIISTEATSLAALIFLAFRRFSIVFLSRLLKWLAKPLCSTNTARTDLSESTTYTYLMIRTIGLRIGLSFITMPLNTAGLNALPRQLGTHGTAVNNTVRQIAGAIGTAVVITIYTAQTTSHAATVLRSNPSTTAEHLKSLASMLGASDAYYFMMILAAAAFVITLFMPVKSKLLPDKKANAASKEDPLL